MDSQAEATEKEPDDSQHQINFSCIEDKDGRVIAHLSKKFLSMSPSGENRSATLAQSGRCTPSLNERGTNPSKGPQGSQESCQRETEKPLPITHLKDERK